MGTVHVIKGNERVEMRKGGKLKSSGQNGEQILSWSVEKRGAGTIRKYGREDR